MNHDPRKVSSVAQRIRGAITAILAITAFTIGANAATQNVQVACIIAGMLYLMTTLVFVFENGVDTGEG